MSPKARVSVYYEGRLEDVDVPLETVRFRGGTLTRPRRLF
jgi:hypothetical protein